MYGFGFMPSKKTDPNWVKHLGKMKTKRRAANKVARQSRKAQRHK